MLKKKMLFLTLAIIAFLNLNCSLLSFRESNATLKKIYLNTPDCRSDNHVEKDEDCYKVCADLHFFRKGFKSEPPEIKISENPDIKKRTLYIGDIFDLENAIQYEKKRGGDENKIRDRVEAEIEKLYEILGDNYIRGNHEFDSCQQCVPWKIINGIYFTHGHRLCWHDDKVKYWESGKITEKGCYYCESNCFEGAKKVAESNNKIHAIVFGHKHKTKIRKAEIEREREGLNITEPITIIQLKKGCSYVKIPRP